jgi:hypothetical protein
VLLSHDPDVEGLVCVIALHAMKSRCASRRQIAVRKPRVGEDRRRCKETVLVDRNLISRSGSERLFAFVRSMSAGR